MLTSNGLVKLIFIQFWFWLTPIVYPAAILPESVRPMLDLNPTAHIIGTYQTLLVKGQMPDWASLLPAFVPAMHLFSHSPSVAPHMLKHLAQKIQRDSEFRALLSINNTAKRIYTYLVLMQRKPGDDGGQPVVENLPTHQDIANMINTSRETVTRALLTLVQQGIVQKDQHKLTILDPEALQKLVQGT